MCLRLHGSVCKLDHLACAQVFLFQYRSQCVILLSNRLKSANEVAVILWWGGRGLLGVGVKVLNDAAQFLAMWFDYLLSRCLLPGSHGGFLF